jgi:hypothetical protein
MVGAYQGHHGRTCMSSYHKIYGKKVLLVQPEERARVYAERLLSMSAWAEAVAVAACCFTLLTNSILLTSL